MFITSIVIGIIVAAVVLMIMRSGMNTKQKQHSAADYMESGSYRLRLHQDLFLYSQVTKTPRQQNNSSGGSSSGKK